MPDKIYYDERSETLRVGDGRICPVPVSVWNYRVSKMRVVEHWFGYRKKRPSGKRVSDLDHIVATFWTPTMTTELLDLVNVLGRCVALEFPQAELLDEIMAAPQITVVDLKEAGVLPVPAAAAKEPPTPIEAAGLWPITEQPACRSPDQPASPLVPEARQASEDLLGVDRAPITSRGATPRS
jgi:hypothetical protein